MSLLRHILPSLTAVMVLCNALLCLCGPVRAETGESSATPACHGQTELETTDQGDAPAHGHDGNCDCHGAAAVSEATPTSPVTPPSELSTPLLVSLPTWQLLPLSDGPSVASAIRASSVRPPGNAGSLLRQHCALNL